MIIAVPVQSNEELLLCGFIQPFFFFFQSFKCWCHKLVLRAPELVIIEMMRYFTLVRLNWGSLQGQVDVK